MSKNTSGFNSALIPNRGEKYRHTRTGEIYKVVLVANVRTRSRTQPVGKKNPLRYSPDLPLSVVYEAPNRREYLVTIARWFAILEPLNPDTAPSTKIQIV